MTAFALVCFVNRTLMDGRIIMSYSVTVGRIAESVEVM